MQLKLIECRRPLIRKPLKRKLINTGKHTCRNNDNFGNGDSYKRRVSKEYLLPMMVDKIVTNFTIAGLIYTVMLRSVLGLYLEPMRMQNLCGRNKEKKRHQQKATCPAE